MSGSDNSKRESEAVMERRSQSGEGLGAKQKEEPIKGDVGRGHGRRRSQPGEKFRGSSIPAEGRGFVEVLRDRTLV